ncbi:MAG: nucleoside transporter C-terminal domain-containing protein [Rhodothermales bacterium]
MEVVTLLLRGLIGIAVLLGLAVLLSSNRRQIDWKVVGIGIGLQIIFALLILKTAAGYAVFEWIGAGFASLLAFTDVGSDFIFGSFREGAIEPPLLNFAFKVLPTIIFFAALMAVLYHLRVIQPIVKGMGWFMAKTMKLSGAESLSAAANVFIGQTEAPLVVRPFIDKMTKSELMTLMTGGMATIAGGVLAAYIGMLGGESLAEQAKFAAHLLAASMMSAPAAIVMAKILIPETQQPETMGQFELAEVETGGNVLEAAASGAGEGLKLAANVGAMLLAFLALIAMVNAMLGWVGNPTLFGAELWNINDGVATATAGRFEGLTLQSIFGFVFAPLAWAMGVESADILSFGSLMGEKIAVTEFVAYLSLGSMQGVMSERSIIMGTYALCGFANFGSIAIQIGGIGGLAPKRRTEIASLAVRAVIGGALASWMTATVAGMLI